MGCYHNKLDKKYFDKSVYVKKWEDTFGVKVKSIPLQYELLYETYSTLLNINNIYYAQGYSKTSDRVKRIISDTKEYLTKYKNKIKKSYDSNCIFLYEEFGYIVEELEDTLETYSKKNNTNDTLKSHCDSLMSEISKYILVLDLVDFDKMIDSKALAYVKKPNDKIPKKVNLKLMDDLDQHVCTIWELDKQKQLNEEFIESYSKWRVDLNNNEEQRGFTFEILNRIKDLNNAMVDYFFVYNKDKTIVNIYNFSLKEFLEKIDISFIKDIEFVKVFERLQEVSQHIEADNMEVAFTIIKELVEKYSDLYERMS